MKSLARSGVLREVKCRGMTMHAHGGLFVECENGETAECTCCSLRSKRLSLRLRVPNRASAPFANSDGLNLGSGGSSTLAKQPKAMDTKGKIDIAHVTL